MILDYFSIAFKNLRKRGLRSWLTILGVFIGIAAVVSLISMGQGLQTAITSQFGGLAVDRLTIQNKGTGFGPPGSTVVEKLNSHDLEIIENTRGIDLTVTRLIRVIKLEYNEISGFGYLGDIPKDKELADYIYESDNLEIQEGRLLTPGDKGKIVFGNDFLTTQEFGKEFSVGKKVKINGKDFEVVGFLKKSSTFVLNGVILMMKDDVENLLEIEDEIDLIAVRIQDKDQVENIANEIERKLREDRREEVGEESFSVETPLDSLESVNTVLNIINLIVIGIAAISLFVGGVGIANTMYTSVIERTKEIGVMKAIGAQNKDILIIFLIESGLLGLVGGLVGATIGLLGAIGAANIANQALGNNLFIVSISYSLIIGSVVFSFAVGALSGILPAFQASKLNVVDALRS